MLAFHPLLDGHDGPAASDVELGGLVRVNEPLAVGRGGEAAALLLVADANLGVAPAADDDLIHLVLPLAELLRAAERNVRVVLGLHIHVKNEVAILAISNLGGGFGVVVFILILRLHRHAALSLFIVLADDIFDIAGVLVVLEPPERHRLGLLLHLSFGRVMVGGLILQDATQHILSTLPASSSLLAQMMVLPVGHPLASLGAIHHLLQEVGLVMVVFGFDLLVERPEL